MAEIDTSASGPDVAAPSCLPTALLLQISSFLTPSDVCAMCATCRRWREVCCVDLQPLWREFVSKKFGRKYENYVTFTGDQDWRRLYLKISKFISNLRRGNAHVSYYAALLEPPLSDAYEGCLAMATDCSRLLWENGSVLQCVDIDKGKELWRVPVAHRKNGSSRPSVVVGKSKVFLHIEQQVHVYELTTGAFVTLLSIPPDDSGIPSPCPGVLDSAGNNMPLDVSLRNLHFTFLTRRTLFVFHSETLKLLYKVQHRELTPQIDTVDGIDFCWAGNRCCAGPEGAECHECSVHGFMFRPQCQQICRHIVTWLVKRSKSIQIWDIRDGSHVDCLSGHEAPVQKVRHVMNWRDIAEYFLASLDTEGIVRIWASKNRQFFCLQELRPDISRGSVFRMSFSTTHLMAMSKEAAGRDVLLTIWRFDQDAANQLLRQASAAQAKKVAEAEARRARALADGNGEEREAAPDIVLSRRKTNGVDSEAGKATSGCVPAAHASSCSSSLPISFHCVACHRETKKWRAVRASHQRTPAETPLAGSEGEPEEGEDELLRERRCSLFRKRLSSSCRDAGRHHGGSQPSRADRDSHAGACSPEALLGHGENADCPARALKACAGWRSSSRYRAAHSPHCCKTSTSPSVRRPTSGRPSSRSPPLSPCAGTAGGRQSARRQQAGDSSSAASLRHPLHVCSYSGVLAVDPNDPSPHVKRAFLYTRSRDASELESGCSMSFAVARDGLTSGSSEALLRSPSPVADVMQSQDSGTQRASEKLANLSVSCVSSMSSASALRETDSTLASASSESRPRGGDSDCDCPFCNCGSSNRCLFRRQSRHEAQASSSPGAVSRASARIRVVALSCSPAWLSIRSVPHSSEPPLAASPVHSTVVTAPPLPRFQIPTFGIPPSPPRFLPSFASAGQGEAERSSAATASPRSPSFSMSSLSHSTSAGSRSACARDARSPCSVLQKETTFTAGPRAYYADFIDGQLLALWNFSVPSSDRRYTAFRYSLSDWRVYDCVGQAATSPFQRSEDEKGSPQREQAPDTDRRVSREASPAQPALHQCRQPAIQYVQGRTSVRQTVIVMPAAPGVYGAAASGGETDLGTVVRRSPGPAAFSMENRGDVWTLLDWKCIALDPRGNVTVYDFCPA
ncbi:F-box domain-containing protein [Besnoitia besnoiti]|uniref:F-box domain-containing protein n=1 Tax=Besnoitia besnoiti TaxID=94643 RepID=A0A2A9M3R0_BESBE|nr:F-box domain-containing protein [Besnoitia besnoiti]PFH32579.1 F-box domain-containing protein [Besnoitia besnoiti]